MKTFARFGFTLLSCLLFIPQLKAQLSADFTMDKNSGCSPLVVQFSNTTQGASPNAKWQWDFSNGNSSSLKNPAAVFSTETTYNITLTVVDGALTSAKTKTITVYKKPVIDFTITPVNGCTPLSTSLTGIVTGGDGTISLWNWDFGDGNIQQTASPVTNHLYTFKQTASVSVTAISNYGCSGVKLKENIVVVKDSVQASFSADKRTLCEPGAAVSFTNTSTGAGTLTYSWDFGDGRTSSAASPTHIYTERGIFTVTLAVTSSEGCTLFKTEKDYINIGSFVTDFAVPSITCENSTIQFRNTSKPIPTQSNWFVNGSPVAANSDTALEYFFPSSGIYTIRLVNNFGICQQEITKQVEINASPKIDSFVVEHGVFCNAPFLVNFRDTSSEAVGWRWFLYSYDGEYSTTQNTSHNFYSDGSHYVRLEIDNAAGCTATITDWVSIQKLNIYIEQDDTVGTQACDSLTKKFKVNSNYSVVSYFWQFGDGSTSTDASPVHTYTVPGEYLVTLTYTTANGCTGLINGPSIWVMKQPAGDFTVVPTVCGNNYVHINPTNNGGWFWFRVDWGDSTGLGWHNDSHRYQAEGVYTITMIIDNANCADTIIKKDIITVKGPFPRIHQVGNTCNGDRNEITFTDSTGFNDKWTWDFGDGNSTSYTSYQPVVKHTYANSGKYWVNLTTQKGDCILEESIEVFVLKKQKPVLSLSNETICINEPEPFQISNLEPNYYILSDNSPRYIFKKWEHAGATPFNGSWVNDGPGWLDGKLIFNQVKKDSIRMIMTSYFHNCEDTTNYVATEIKGVTTDFTVLSDNICFKSPVVLKDNSVATVGNTISSWTWDFGDGQQLTTSSAGIVNHYFNSPGQYIVKLTASDEAGCSSSVTNYTQPVTVLGAKAAFTVSPGTSIAPGMPVQFTNNSNTDFAGLVTWQWNFGDGAVSNDKNPVHVYTMAGTYTARLIATDHGSNCRDTAFVIITCVPEQTNFTTTTAFIGEHSACPPVQANFAYSSNLPYDSIVWNFGDGFSLQNQTHPNHIYTIPGKYIVTLHVYNKTKLTGTHRDTIFVSAPTAAIAADDLDGCIGDLLSLYSTLPDSGYNYTWDFGNGTVIKSTDSLAANIYNTAGTFSPVLVVQNTAGCAVSVKLANNINIHPDPVISILPFNAVACKGNGVQLQANGGLQYVWSPVTGINNNMVSNPVVIPPINTNYTVQATDEYGCKGSAAVSVIVPQPFSIEVTSGADICIGEKVQLQASGAITYQWLNDVAGLSNTSISNPVASPPATTTYTVVGYDQYQCYSDTNDVVVSVRPSPTISLGIDLQAAVGTPISLQSTGSPDIERWQWTPADYLSCSACPVPVSTPMSSIEYILRVFNQFNCEAVDTIKINTLCEGTVSIPNAFTPNHDGLNDLFGIPQGGVSKVTALRIFNRWGEIVFEKKDFVPGNSTFGWDGKYKGLDAPEGVYVYIIELECLPGERFQQKGTVMLLR